MLSVTSMARNSYLLYTIMQKAGGTNTTPTDWLNSLSGTSTKNTATSSTDWLNRSIANNLSTSTSNTSLSDIISQQIAKQGTDIKALESYAKNQAAFSEKFSKLTTALQKSSDTLLHTDFKAAASTATTTTSTGAASTQTTRIADLVSNIKGFTADYNNVSQFFKDNSGLSSSVRNLATSFADTKYNRRAYESIGINVDTSGKLSVDEKKLTASLQSDAGNVGQLLGENGLAGKAAKKTAAAVNISANLYPALTLQSSSNSLNSASLLSGLMLDFYW